MPGALRVWKYWQITAAPHWVKVVAGDLSSVVTRGPHVTRSLCLPKSLSSWSFLPVQTPSALWWRGKAEGSLQVTAERKPGSKRPGEAVPSMDTSCQANDQPQGVPETDEEQPQVEPSPQEPSPEEHRPEEPCPEELSTEEPSSEDQSSSEEEFFPEELLPELLGPEGRPPEERLPGPELFEARPPMEQPPCGVGKHKLEEGSFKERLARSRPQFKGDIHGRNLSNEEMIQVAEEMEEMKRVRNKLMIMHWKARRNRPYPI
ncbi:transcription elongation factor A protein-like 1 isoform X2 [Pipistrellus kuhlii]|uniref:transcription elongation factor A protein-like 1 isoform X2 n=1 Tax=Pipistrellus kuhlii TaxID=59472 RepID=UPI00174F52AB|nr:transcription elongation factor A protein-like 1 isoform X2 [Pipistrellus kuhlii]